MPTLIHLDFTRTEEFVIRLYHDRSLLVRQGEHRVERSLEEPVRSEAGFRVCGHWRTYFHNLPHRLASRILTNL